MNNKLQSSENGVFFFYKKKTPDEGSSVSGKNTRGFYSTSQTVIRPSRTKSLKTKSHSQGSILGTSAELSVETPVRESILLSPSALVQVGASPLSKRYDSVRKIEFEYDSSKKSGPTKKLNFKYNR
ncbi:hypothetical protein ENBRE01_1603 [Enteropsectra breve]|nr:hypothetical protein ENBRE01_1603 [Enteropsectra breve]